MIVIKNVVKKFGSNIILDDISLNIEERSIIGLAGPSGGGKSTLLRCIQKFEKIDNGTIKNNGKTGFMFQDFQLFPHMSILENLVYAKNIKKKSSKNTVKAMGLLKDLGIEHKANSYPSELSGGQKQRVALARSLMLEPDILLCDEPTSGLDVATISDVVNLLKQIREMNVTMIIASHDLDFLTQIADRVILLKQGKIAIDIIPTESSIEQLKQYYNSDY